jgi:hypothetical protein
LHSNAKASTELKHCLRESSYLVRASYTYSATSRELANFAKRSACFAHTSETRHSRLRSISSKHDPDGNIDNVTVTANNVNNVNYFDGPARGVGHVLNPLAPAFDNRAAPLRIADEDRDEMPLHSLPTTSLRLEPEARIRTLSPQSSAYDGDRGGEGGRTPASESPPYNGGSRTPAGPRDASLAPPREEFDLSPQEFIQFIQSHIEVPLRAAGERALLQVLVQHEDDLRVGLMVPRTPSPPPPIVSTPPKRYVEIEEGLWMIVDPRDHSPGSDSNFYDSLSEADSRDNTMEYRKVPDGQYGEYFAEDEGQAEDQVYAEYTSSEDEEFYHLPVDGMDAEDQVDAEHLFSEDGAYTEHPFPDDEALTDYDDPYSEPDPSEAPYSPQPPSPDRLQRPAPAAYSEPESDENHSGPSIFSTPDPADFARRRNSIMRPPAGAEPVFANLIRGSTMFRISASRQTSRRSSNEQRSLIVRCRRRLKEQRRRSSGSDSESDLDDNAIPQPRARLGLGLRNNCGHTLSPLFPVGAAARQAGGVNASPALATVNAATGQRRLPADFAPALTAADKIANLQRTRAGRSRTPPSSYAEGGDELDASGTDSSRTMPASPPFNKRARDDDEDDGEVQFLGVRSVKRARRTRWDN